MTKLILSTGNIVAGGPSIVRKPGALRSNLELTKTLRSSFLAAQQKYGAATRIDGADSPHDDVATATFSNGRLPMDMWTERGQLLACAEAQHKRKADADACEALFIPRIDWSAGGLEEERSQYDVTAKLFFLPTATVALRPRFALEALDLVRRKLRVPDLDLLVVSFPGMSLEGDCEWEADKINAAQGDDEQEAAAWRDAIEPLHRAGLVKRVGIAEFGSDKLAGLLGRVGVRPSVDQINIRNCCSVPPPLVRLAKEADIELLVHSDCTDILPKGTLRELLGQGPAGAGVLADDGAGEGLQGALVPQWLVKYTAVVRDRGVIENKGYFAGAELPDA